MKLGTLVHHVHGYKKMPQIFNFCLGIVMVGVKSSLNFERS